MQTIFVQRKSNSIRTREACPIVITAASPVTSDPGSKVEGSEGAASKCYIRHSTSDGISGSTASTAVVPANQSGKSKKNKSRHYKRKTQKPISNHGYEGLLSLIDVNPVKNNETQQRMGT
jgi:hypothetical protein